MATAGRFRRAQLPGGNAFVQPPENLDGLLEAPASEVLHAIPGGFLLVREGVDVLTAGGKHLELLEQLLRAGRLPPHDQERFQIELANFIKFCKFANFWRARARLYQNEFLQENMRSIAFFKLYKICILLHRCNLNIFAKKSV